MYRGDDAYAGFMPTRCGSMLGRAYRARHTGVERIAPIGVLLVVGSVIVNVFYSLRVCWSLGGSVSLVVLNSLKVCLSLGGAVSLILVVWCS